MTQYDLHISPHTCIHMHPLACISAHGRVVCGQLHASPAACTVHGAAVAGGRRVPCLQALCPTPHASYRDPCKGKGSLQASQSPQAADPLMAFQHQHSGRNPDPVAASLSV